MKPTTPVFVPHRRLTNNRALIQGGRQDAGQADCVSVGHPKREVRIAIRTTDNQGQLRAADR
jgi:hypothetical protein